MRYLLILSLVVSSLFSFVRVPDKSIISTSNVNEVFAFSSVSNSTEATLGTNGVFTGGPDDLLNFSAITILIHADAPSITNGLQIQFSSDFTNWHLGEAYTLLSNATKFFTPPVQSRYMRIVYSNGSQAQSEFHIHTMLKKYPVKWSSHNISDTIVDEDDAELVKAVITGKDPTNGYVNVLSTADGYLSISDNSSGLSIAKGEVTGSTFIHKFGAAPDFDIADNFISVTDLASDGATWELMNYVYATSADIDSLSSDNTGDTIEIEVQGLDASSNLIIQVATLNGTNRVALPTNLIRVFRMINNNGTALAGNVFCFTNNSLTAGVPDVNASIKAVIALGNEQTLMAIFTIPANTKGYMRDWYASTAGAKRSSVHTIKLLARPPGGVFQLKHIANITAAGTSYLQHKYAEPEVFSAGTDIEMRMDTDQDIAGVAAGFDIVLVDD